MKNNLKNVVQLDYRDKKAIKENIDTKLGYRYIYYWEDSHSDDETDGVIELRGYSKKTGERTCFEIRNYPLYILRRTTKATSEWNDSYGKPIVAEYFDNEKMRRKRVNDLKHSENYPGIQIVCNDIPETQFMKEFFMDEAISADGNKGPLRIFYLDIETEISGAFMPPHIAANRINMITVLDSETGIFHTWSLQPVEVLPDTDSGLKHEAHVFDNEERPMLEDFLHFWENNYPDVVCGWNSYEYDIPYIVVRCAKVLGEARTKRLSPFNTYQIRRERTDERDENGNPIEKEEIKNVLIPGIAQLDEMILYKHKFGVKPALDGGYGLSNVGKAEGLGGKVSYESTLLDLYLTNWQKFYEYNVRDVELLYEIEKKCKLLPLARTVCGFGFCNYEDIYFSSSYLINTLALYTLKNRENVVFNTYANNFCQKRPYEGAFVFEPVPNRYSGGIACVDFNSLYPSCMRAMNLSPETYVGHIEWPDGEAQWDTWQNVGGVDGLKDDILYTIVLDTNDSPTQKRIQLTKTQLKELLETKCLICGPNMTLFLKHEIKRGIIADWCSDFFAWRKRVKKEMGECRRQAHKETDNVRREELEARVEVLNNLQQAIKIMLNSVYGLLGASTCVLYNPSIVQSVTRLGRFCNINGSRFYRKWLEENYNIGDQYIAQASGDTDSLFLNLDAVTKDLASKWGISNDTNKWTDEQKMELWNLVSKFVDDTLIPEVQELVGNLCHTSNASVLRYGLEYVGSGGIYESKKHYGVHKIIDEGPELVDKFKFTGIEIKKATVSPEIKQFLKDVYCTAIVDPNFNDSAMMEKLMEIYEKVSNMHPNEIGRWQGYSTEREMGEGFLVVEKGMTGVSKAVGFYNQIAENMGISKKYGTIELGEKVQVVYLKPSNKFGVNIIAFKPRNWPAEFDEVFENSKAMNPSVRANLAYSSDDL